MPKRIRQHELEDTSRAIFKLALPEEWVFRDKPSDYGIDGEVEVFDSGEPTGFVFWVQLKATQAKDTKTQKSVRMKLDTLDYYKRLDIPVLLARHSSRDNVFYVRWTHGIDTYYSRKNGIKTVQVKFEKQDALTANKSSELRNYLQKSHDFKRNLVLPIKSKISVQGGENNKALGVNATLLKTQIRNEINSNTNTIQFANDDESYFSIEVSEDFVKFHILDLAGCYFHNFDRASNQELPKSLAKLSLCSLAYCLGQLNKSELAAEIIVDNELSGHFVKYEQLKWPLLCTVLSTSRFQEGLSIISKISDEEDNNLLESLTQMAILTRTKKNDKTRAAVESFLASCVARSSKRGDNTLIGTANYNLGNFYRSNGEYKKALNCYSKAAKHSPDYRKRSYFYSELGGIFFELKKYHWSTNCYSKAIDLGSEYTTLAQMADAIMFTGKYEKAVETFNSYFDSKESVTENYITNGCWRLKLIFLQELLDEGYVDQVRRRSEAEILGDISTLTSNTEILAKLEAALDHDLLCGFAWFNLGIVHFQMGERAKSAFSFVACSILQPWDIDAWKNATLASMSPSSEVPTTIFALVLQTALYFHGESYLLKIHSEISSQSGPDHADHFIERITSIESLPAEQKKVIFRFLGPGGKFESNVLKV